MTRDGPFDGAIRSADDFDATLTRLLTEAIQNGVDPQGAWECRNDGHSPDYEIIVVELAKSGAAD